MLDLELPHWAPETQQFIHPAPKSNVTFHTVLRDRVIPHTTNRGSERLAMLMMFTFNPITVLLQALHVHSLFGGETHGQQTVCKYLIFFLFRKYNPTRYR